MLPVVLVEDGQVLILRPGDQGYEQALADRLASDGAVGEDLADAARRVWGRGAAQD